MYTIFIKEVSGFLSSLIAYITIIVFLLIVGLFVWVFPDTGIIDYGFATMDSLFNIAPWVFMFLIPAITMRSFSEEKKTGTIELLATRPISDLQIILGKYFAGLLLVVFSILPTVIYYYSVYQLGNPKGNIDSGAVMGSYIGLLLLGACFVSVGIFSSAISDNQIVAFIIAVFVSFICFAGFDSFSALDLFGRIDTIIAAIGINEHYLSISRGVMDSRDVVYFISFIGLFVLLTKIVLESRKW
jgi:ABC-2 type transport system permease protein